MRCERYDWYTLKIIVVRLSAIGCTCMVKGGVGPAALEAASSSTRGSNWTPGGLASSPGSRSHPEPPGAP